MGIPDWVGVGHAGVNRAGIIVPEKHASFHGLLDHLIFYRLIFRLKRFGNTDKDHAILLINLLYLELLWGFKKTIKWTTL